MKNIGLTILGLAFVLVANAQQEETRNLDSFDKIIVSEGIEVIIQQGNEEKAFVQVSGADLEDVKTEVRGSKLDIRMGRGNYRSVDVKVTVTYKSLVGVEANSAGSIDAKNTIKADEFFVEANSAGRIELDLDVNELEVNVNSAGNAELSGKCNYQNIDVNSAGKYDGLDLMSVKVDADVNSGANAKISVSKELRAYANSGGLLKYQGNPDKVISDSDSGGRVRKY